MSRVRKKNGAVIQRHLTIQLESLILAQNERWRRA